MPLDSISKFRKRWAYVTSGAFIDDYVLKLKLRSPSPRVRALYAAYHDNDAADENAAKQTEAAFSKQWGEFPKGNFLLSDPEFRASLPSILSSQELCIDPDWLRGKDVLDVGCGNGRWTYAFSKLGANVTAVDASDAALAATKAAIEEYAPDSNVNLLQAHVEDLSNAVPTDKFDVVFCWGVLHHCRSFSRALRAAVARLKPGGLLFLYLYGRETISLEQDLNYFMERLRFNALASDEDRLKFLLRKAGGDRAKLHNVHDIYAPLINRRFHFIDIKEILQKLNVNDVTRTKHHTELFVRGVSGEPGVALTEALRPAAEPPYWFQRIPEN